MARSFRTEEDVEIILYDEDEVREIIEDFSINYEHVHWLSDEDYAKAIGQFKLQFGALLNEMMEPLRMYGQQAFVDDAILQIIKIGTSLTEDFGLRVRGLNNTISLEIIKAKIKEKEFILMSKRSENS